MKFLGTQEILRNFMEVLGKLLRDVEDFQGGFRELQERYKGLWMVTAGFTCVSMECQVA